MAIEMEPKALVVDIPPGVNALDSMVRSPTFQAVADEKEKEPEQPSLPPVSYWKLYSTADWLDKLLMAGGVVGACGGGVMLPLFSIVFGGFINAFGDPSGSDLMSVTSSLALKFVYLAIGGAVAMYMEVTCFVLAGERQTNRLRAQYLAAVLRQDIAFFDTSATTGGLLQGLNENSMAVQAAISEKAANFIHHSATFVAGFIIAFTYGWSMTLVMLGVLPFLAVMGAVIGYGATAKGNIESTAYEEASTIAQQSISSVRTVAAFNGQQQALVSYEKALDKPVKAGVKIGLIMGFSLGGLQFMMYISYAIGLFYGAYRIIDGDYDGGQVILVQIATLMASFALGQAAPSLQAFGLGRTAAARMFHIIERTPAIIDVGDIVSTNKTGDENGNGNGAKDANGAGPSQDEILPYNGTGEIAGEVAGRISFVDVHFAYPIRTDVPVFKGFSLEVPAGHTVALVGASGCGKSTAIQLIERFYDPQSGAVLLDGVDLRMLKMSFLRSHVGLVSQEPTLFATTIYENIALGKRDVTQEEVMHAATSANAHKFINLLPEGYNTQVGERGVQLSGGQKQRIAIARAILKNPKVLLLDEATSALDTNSERIVQAALDNLVVGRTTVVVAHRLSTIKHAHAIAVVANGAVGEIGTHDELLAKQGGMYNILVQMQMQAAQGGAEVQAEEGVAEDEHDLDPDAPLPQASLGLGGQSSLNGAGPSSALQPTQSTGAGPHSTLVGQVSGGTTGAKAGSLELEGARRTSQQIGDGPTSRLSAPLGSVTVMKGMDAKPEVKKLTDKEREALDEAKAKDVSMGRLLSLNKPEWPLLGFGIAASIIAGCQHPALAFVFSDMVTIFFTTDMDELKTKASFYAWMFFVIAVGALASVMAQQACLSLVGSRLALRVRVLLLGSLLSQEIAFFDDDEHGSGRLTSALATDATYIRGAVADAAAVGVQNLATLALGYLIAFAYNWQMALVVTGTFPFIITAMVLQMRFATGASSTSDKLYAGANQYITEAFSSIRVIHAYNLQYYISGMYEKMLESTRPTLTKQAHIGGIGMGFSFSMMFAMYALIVWFGGWQLAHDQTTFNGFLKGFMSILLAAMGMAQAGIAFPDLGRAKGAVGRVFPLLDRVPAIPIDDPEGQKPPEETVKGEVGFSKIRFSYPSRPGVIIYSDFNLTIPAGKVYALVGESGSGKSTVVGLLERFYDPLEGSVMLDGVDIRKYNLKWLRKQIGLVSQEPILFAGTIADNIRYGADHEIPMDELEGAARTANAIEFINKLPDGLNTRVGEGGIQLSGGQKQRIAIARAVLKNPRVLLLDEATSALDARSERVVQDALDGVMAGRTCMVIAHRLSTIKNANAISVLYRGAVLEQGTHAELMAIPDGAYAKLVAAQEKAHGAK